VAREGFEKGAGESIERVEGGHRLVTEPINVFLTADGEDEWLPVTLYVFMAAFCLDLLKPREG
jgi:hypothetical protein